MFNDIAGRPDHHRGNTVFFKLPADQTHGLMAYGSYGDDDHRIEVVRATHLKRRGTLLLQYLALRVVVVCAVNVIRHSTDPPVRNGFTKPVDWEKGVNIVERRRISVVIEGAAIEPLGRRVRRN